MSMQNFIDIGQYLEVAQAVACFIITHHSGGKQLKCIKTMELAETHNQA